jgi:endoglucanase
MRMIHALIAAILLVAPSPSAASPDYGLALSKGLLHFEAQRSGRLPADNRVPWRDDCCLSDGMDASKDLSRAYFDSGDHVVFGLPMSFSLTMMAYGLVEYGDMYGDSYERAVSALKWGTDWLLRAHASPNELYVQVGDGDKDHACWTRPEDMTMARPSFKVDTTSPGSEPAAEAAAALAAASLVFKKDPAYRDSLLQHATELFRFADSHRGVYSDSVPAAAAFYKSYSGFGDELLWAAAWLHRATSDAAYLDYVRGIPNDLGWTAASTEVSWDDKKAAAHVLLSRLVNSTTTSNGGALDAYKSGAESFVCAYLSGAVPKTAGGLSFVREWLPLQYVTTSSFLIAVYGEYLRKSKGAVECSGKSYGADDLLSYSKGQADYILGKNPLGMSYMVGFGTSYPKRVHHRAASIPQDNVKYGCGEGFRFFQTLDPNPNVLEGSVVGGPDSNDRYRDDRTRYQESEPSTYTTAPFLGLLARLSSKGSPSPPPSSSSPPRPTSSSQSPKPAPGPTSSSQSPQPAPRPTSSSQSPKPAPGPTSSSQSPKPAPGPTSPTPAPTQAPAPSPAETLTCTCACGSF